MSTYAHKELDELSREELLDYARDLQLRVGKFASVEQQLINIRDRLDAEVVIHKQMNVFNENAFRVAEPMAFFRLVAESVLDIFEFEFGIAIYYKQIQEESNLLVAEGLEIPDTAINCLIQVFRERFEALPEKKVIQFNKGDWHELLPLIPFHQFILAHVFNKESGSGIFVAGGILEKGARNYRAIEPQRVNAFELFTKQVFSHYSSHEKTFRIEKSEARLTALANTFLDFGSVPLDNISNITSLSFNMLDADLVFYKSTSRDEPVLFFNEDQIDGRGFLEKGDLELFYKSFSSAEKETMISINQQFSKYLKAPQHDGKVSLAVSHLIRQERELTGMLGFCFSSATTVTQEDLQIIGIIGSAIAVEEKRQLVRQTLISSNEELFKINSELDNFVYSVSHDLRTPLLAVKGLASLINLQNGSREENEEFFRLIGDSIDRMDNTIIEILDYSRNARLQINPEPVDLHTMIMDAYADVKYYAAHPISLELKMDKDLVFDADRYRLNTVIKNLIGNAVKYADELKDQSFVKVRAYKLQDALVIEVSDNGIGIEAFNLDKVFNMFFRASEKTTGTGLGLYIAKEIIIKLHGDISIKSELGKGTTARISLPVDFKK